MTRSDYSTRSDASDKALAAVCELHADLDDPHIAHELLGRLCWLAPDAVLEAVDAARRAATVDRIAADMRAARELCGEVYTPEGVEVWMRARNRRFEWRTATELIEAGETERVLQVLDQLASGAYA